MTGYRLACDFLHVADIYVYSWQCSLSDSNSHTQQIGHDLSLLIGLFYK